MKKLFRKDDKGVSPVIAVILMVAITVVLAGVLYVWVSQFSTGSGGGSVKISSLKTEKQTAFLITISSVSGGTLNLDEAEFQITDEDGTLQYRLNINDANPATVSSGQSIIYPMTAGTVAVTDPTGGALDSAVSLSDYTNCTIAYIDQNDDEKVSADDSMWIYMDNNNDGTDDVENKYTFKIVDGNDETVHSKQL
jgi:flagellin-like protein